MANPNEDAAMQAEDFNVEDVDKGVGSGEGVDLGDLGID